MADPRTALAAVLGIGLGLLLVAAPGLAISAHTVGRVPRDRHGGYGTEREPPARWRWAVRGTGVAFVLAGAYVGWLAV